MARGPGFIDDPKNGVFEPPPVAPEAPQPPSNTSGPMLLDAVAREARTRIDPLWEPALVVTRETGPSSMSWIATGLAVLLLSWLLLSLVAFVEDQFRRSPVLGASTLSCFGIALGLVAYGVWCELRAFRALQRVDALRSRISTAAQWR
jgi:uncharacterized membrane protein YcjF (UPF0283 family)